MKKFETLLNISMKIILKFVREQNSDHIVSNIT